MIGKNWMVTFSQMTDGRIKEFRLAGNALQYAKKHFNEAPYIDLENRKTGLQVRLKAPENHQWTLGLKS